MLKIDLNQKALLLEALEDMMYKLSLQQERLKGKPLNKQRKDLNKKQESLEELQHLISNAPLS